MYINLSFSNKGGFDVSEKDEKGMEINFEEEVQRSGWELLKDHFERGNLYKIDSDVDLLKVSRAMAGDDVGFIKSLLDKKKMATLSESEIEALKQGKEVSFTIASPFVLIQFDQS